MENGEVAAVVVSVVSGTSYDSLFRKVPQDSDMGKICTYSIKAGTILEKIIRTLQGEPIKNLETSSEEAKVLQQLKDNCDKAGRDAVCFNFECCSHYSGKHFGSLKAIQRMHMDLIGYLVNEYGCLCMFSDFSLKALIKDWDSSLLGPNPFVEVGSISRSFRLKFNPEILKNSPSAQLETVGNLCDKGHGEGSTIVGAMGGTIAYTLKKFAADEVKAPTPTKHVTRNRQKEAIAVMGNDSGQKELVELDSRIPEAGAVQKSFLRRFFSICGCGASIPNAAEVSLSAETIDAPVAVNVVADSKSTSAKTAAFESGVPYTVQVLTIADQADNSQITESYLEEAGDDVILCAAAGLDKTGLAGHVLLEYPPIADQPPKEEDEEDDEPIRGRILASCGHWIELMKVDTNVDRLLHVAEREWGVKSPQYQNAKMEMMNATAGSTMQKENMQKWSHQLVQSRAPHKYNRRLVKAKKARLEESS